MLLQLERALREFLASYFPKAGNLNGSNAGMCSDVAGQLSTGLGDLFELFG